MLYTCGEGTTPVPPVVDSAGGRAWYVCRSKYARTDSTSKVRAYGAEPAKFDLTTGNYTLFATNATIDPTVIPSVGDETCILSADAWGLLVSDRGTLSYLRHSPESSVHVLSSLPVGSYTYNGVAPLRRLQPPEQPVGLSDHHRGPLRGLERGGRRRPGRRAVLRGVGGQQFHLLGGPLGPAGPRGQAIALKEASHEIHAIDHPRRRPVGPDPLGAGP